ncbi:MAG: nucleotidyl transferase AbiEii/AbiGii toxin family protein [Bacteroidetes bacterium]|nr:nucleotidyl transferase AbiEii/AbiGii toxin family protein [Bacteroidota bacterium]
MELNDLQEFYLAGGTALALQIGHRLSLDLDLFSSKDFQIDSISDLIRSRFQTKITGEFHNTLNLFLNEVKVDLITYNYPLISEITREEGIRLASIPDIAAMKLSALAQRGSRKDFYDIYFLLKDYSITQLLQFHREKFSQTEQFHIVKSLTYFEDAEKEPDPILIKTATWQKVKQELQNVVTTF